MASPNYEIRVLGVLPAVALLDFDLLIASVEPAETVRRGPPGIGQGSAGTWACVPFCQADAPADTAARAWAHFALATSLGGVSISLIHWRVAEAM